MKNKITYILSILILAVLMNGFLIYLSLSYINSKNENLYNNQDAVRNYYLENTLMESFFNNDTRIEKFLNELKNNNIYTADSTKAILVVHYSSLSCNPCIEFVMNKIKEHFPTKENKDILIFAANYKKNADLGFKDAMNIGNLKLRLSIEDSNIPLLYIVKNNTITHIFTPNPNYPEYLDKYLKMIKKRYYDNLL